MFTSTEYLIVECGGQSDLSEIRTRNTYKNIWFSLTLNLHTILTSETTPLRCQVFFRFRWQHILMQCNTWKQDSSSKTGQEKKKKKRIYRNTRISTTLSQHTVLKGLLKGQHHQCQLLFRLQLMKHNTKIYRNTRDNATFNLVQLSLPNSGVMSSIFVPADCLSI